VNKFSVFFPLYFLLIFCTKSGALSIYYWKIMASKNPTKKSAVKGGKGKKEGKKKKSQAEIKKEKIALKRKLEEVSNLINFV